ncbi:Serine palmitoyltransferase 1 [Psilocybe cubensis]|uniref:serine C-palmitoyltransferase n=2 Tax=Psilocybe cubensis TaxID=181762 RepID=A0A8H7XUB6_PSICU|nr:Serine palmitoyltransferase 1 [Psilocybe cubensis]KAH9474532.1 Serine palmitoyltransferase 1 [Psilocybe cubensis]
MNTTSATLAPVFTFLEHTLTTAQTTFNKLPGSAVIQRYVKSSHQNDPGRTLLELILVIFAIRTLLQSRTRADRNGKNFIQFSEKEIDELVDEWIPEPLGNALTANEQSDLASAPIISGPNGPKPKLAATGKNALNLASYNFTGLAGNEHIKQRAIDTLRKYGLGSCGPPGFYGTLDVHMDLENDIADFLGTEAAILYSQGFSTISSVIPAFCKRGDIIVADRAVNFAIQKGIQISRSTIRWFDHNDLNSLEEVLIGIEKERKKRRGPMTRRFIVTEGIFQKDGAMVDLPKLIELKYKYKYRLILDESYSFGSVGRTGRGLTELYNVPASKVDMLLGSCAIGLASAGGFCAGSRTVVDHQRINGPSFVFSASMPALLAVSASEGINILRNTPSIFETLQDNVRAARAILDRVDCITIPSHPASPIIHIYVRQPQSHQYLQYPAPISASSSSSSAKHHHSHHVSAKDAVRDAEYEVEERLLQEVVEETLSHGVIVTRAKRLKGQEIVEPRPSIRLTLTSGLTKKETEKAVNVLKTVLVKVLSKRR